MTYVYEHRHTVGAVRIIRRWEPDAEQELPDATGTGLSTAGRDQVVWSQRSRRSMRYRWSGLPWELLGTRPVMITYTYPARWRDVCADARAMVAQRRAMQERWRRTWGTPIGGWVVEFQPRKLRPEPERQAPHLHTYVGLPDEVTDEEFNRYILRTHRSKALQRQHGKYRGKAMTPPPKGEFAEWLLRSWYEVVASRSMKHRHRGIDITPCFWTEKAERDMSRGRIGEYFWRESGKWGQKTPPEGFGGLSFYGEWGKNKGFRPQESEAELERKQAYILRRVYHRVNEDERRKECQRNDRKFVPRPIRGRNGVTAFMVEARTKTPELLHWAASEASDRQAQATEARLAGGPIRRRARPTVAADLTPPLHQFA